MMNLEEHSSVPTQRIGEKSCYTRCMSKEQIRALRILARNIRKNSPRIERKLRKAGIKPDPALVYTAAKYYDALDRLAKA